MKIALCLSGQSRKVDTRGIKIDWTDALPYFRKNLLDLHEIDIFIHTWDNPGDNELKSDLIRDFSPAGIKIEKSIFPNYDVERLNLNIPFDKGHYTGSTGIQAAMSRWDSQQKSNEIRKRFQEETGDSYDFILCCRFDLLLYSPFPFDKMNPAHYYVSNWHAFWNPEDRFYGYQDCWFISGDENTNVHCDLFDDLINYWQDDSDLSSYCINFLKQKQSVKFSSHVLSRWHMLNKGLISNERYYGVEYETWSLSRKKDIKKNPHWTVPWGAHKIFNPQKIINKMLDQK